MTGNIQNKINQIRKLAKSPVSTVRMKNSDTTHTNDNLLRSIRNAREAEIFLAELSAVAKISQHRKD